MQLRVKVVPGASRNEAAGWLGEEFKIRVSAPPEGGRANKAVIQLLAKLLDIPRGKISIVSGATSTHKTVEIEGVTEKELRTKLGAPAVAS